MTVPVSNLVVQRDPTRKEKWRFAHSPKENGSNRFPRYGGGRVLHLVDERANELAPAVSLRDNLPGYNQYASNSHAGMLWSSSAAFCFFLQKYAVVYPRWGDVLPLVVDLERLVPTTEYDLQQIQSEYRSKVRRAVVALLEGLEKGETPQQALQGTLDEYASHTTALHHAGNLRIIELEDCLRKLKKISRKPSDKSDRIEDVRLAAAVALRRLGIGINEEQAFLDAAARGDTETLTTFLPKVDVNWRAPSIRCINEATYCSGNGGRSALDFAASNGHVQVVKILLRNERIEVSETHLRSAGSKDTFFLILDYVMAKGGKSADYILRRKPLTQLYPGPASVDVVEELLQRGFDPDQSDYHGVTALHDACDIGNIDLVRIWLNAGSDPDMKTTKGKTPFYMAIEKGHNDIAEYLLMIYDHLDINVTPKERRLGRSFGIITLEPALCLLSKRGDLAMVKKLLEHRKYHALSAVEAALCGAMEANHLEVFKLLLCSLQDNFPAHLSVFILEETMKRAVGAVHQDYVLLLLSHRHANWKCLSSSLETAAEEENVKMVLFLLEQDKIPPTTKCLLPALKEACCCGHLDMVKLLLDRIL